MIQRLFLIMLNKNRHHSSIKKRTGLERSRYLFRKAKELKQSNFKGIITHLTYLNRLNNEPPLTKAQVNTILHMALYNFKGWKQQIKERVPT